MKRKILFVDDERNILQGLRRMLHGMHDVWDMRFADGGHQALLMLAEDPADVIVSDMRMLGMDGVELLTRVKADYPHMVRIVLSGHADSKTILKTVRLAHQYISKPCGANQLKITIDRACMLKEMLVDDELRRQVARMETLPGLPTVYARITQALKDPECSIQQVGDIIAQDIGMTAKILQLVNSAFYGLARHVSGPAEAAVYLGLDTIRALVLTIGLFSDFAQSGIPSQVVQSLYDHSIKTGNLARDIALSASLGKEHQDDAFMAGLLHDLGKLVLAYHMPKTYGRLLKLTLEKKSDIQAAEEQLLGTTHGRIGAYLIGLWGLPHSIVEAVAFHHTPSQCPSAGFDSLGALHVANALVHRLPGDPHIENPVAKIDYDYLARVEATAHMGRWMEMAKKAA